VNNAPFKVHYLRAGEAVISENSLDEKNFAVAWVEAADHRVHYFWFRLSHCSYVLTARHFARRGLQTTLLQVTEKQVLTSETIRNVNRWKHGVSAIAGNECFDDVHSYQRTILKQEGEQGVAFVVRLDIQLFTLEQIGDSIENPVVVIDSE
jgi:hypothetical protein